MTEPFAALAARFERIPKVALFAAAALIQIVLVAAMIIDRAAILRDGTEVTLQTGAVDPRDPLRGDYVTLSYFISRMPAGALRDQPSGSRDPTVFVKLVPAGDGTYGGISVHTEPVPVTGPEVLIRGHVVYGASCGSNANSFCDTLQIRYNLESYFVPEDEGKKLQDARIQRKVRVVAAVLPSGRAAIKRLLIDGQPAYEESWF
jgi:uncharacterized membrane-anchored protein